MCQSKAQGGQRCYGHVRKSLVRAYDADLDISMSADPAKAAEAKVNLHATLVDLASTAKGREDLTAIVNNPYGKKHDEDIELVKKSLHAISRGTAVHKGVLAERILEEGELVAERNRAIKDAATMDDKVARFGDRAMRIAKSFAPAVVAAGNTFHMITGGRNIGLTGLVAAASVGLAYLGYLKYQQRPEYRSAREKAMRQEVTQEVHARSLEREADKVKAFEKDRARRDREFTQYVRTLR